MTDHRTDKPMLFAGGRTSEALQQLSHDVRSAMSDVLGGVRLVDTARLDPQTQTQIDRVRAAADTLAALVDDVLLTASGETLFADASSSVVVTDWLEATQNRWFGRAAERDCAFSISTHGDLPAVIEVPPVALDRIVGNLISNALLHGAGGAVCLDVRCTIEGALILSVRDEGAGFPTDVLSLSQDAKTKAPDTRGSGLGLRIVRDLSAKIGAEVVLSNDAVTGGACACIALPAHLSNWSAKPKETMALSDLTGLRILVAEDNLTNQTILRQMLDQMGASSVFVADGLAAMDALQRDAYDLGLIDIEMPRMSGLEVMEQVRASSGDLARMPLVAITAYVMRDNREAIYAAGADGIIGKPVASGPDFGRAILRHVGQPVDLPPLQEVGHSADLAQQMDSAQLDSLLAAAGHHGSAELLDRVTEDLTQVQTHLEESVATQNTDVIRSQTHILIAISGAVGAARLCQLAEVLNIAAKRGNMDQLPAIHASLNGDLMDLLDVIKDRTARLGA
jgi:two-component system aerobic respiration control sensor histidine kinase ArcB